MTFKTTVSFFGGKGFVTGNPVRPEFFETEPAPRGGPPRLLVFGGSQGAHAINVAMAEAAPELAARRLGLDITHQTGERDLELVRDAYRRAGIEARVTAAYDKWVKEKGCVFRLRDGIDGHHDTIKLRWEMLPAAGGEVISIGFDFMVLGKDGRILTGYQFIEA